MRQLISTMADLMVVVDGLVIDASHRGDAFIIIGTYTFIIYDYLSFTSSSRCITMPSLRVVHILHRRVEPLPLALLSTILTCHQLNSSPSFLSTSPHAGSDASFASSIETSYSWCEESERSYCSIWFYTSHSPNVYCCGVKTLSF